MNDNNIFLHHLYHQKCYPRRKKHERIRTTILKMIMFIEEKFNLHPQTFFITLNIFDHMMQSNKNFLFQFSDFFLAKSLIFIASKFEDVIQLEIMSITKSLKEKKQIIEFEKEVLTTLSYRIPHITSYSFLLQIIFLFPDWNHQKIHDQALVLLRKGKFQCKSPFHNAIDAISATTKKSKEFFFKKIDHLQISI